MFQIVSVTRSLRPSVIVHFFGSSHYPTITRVGMIGLGLMGHGIAQTAAQAGYKVIGYEHNESAIATGRSRIKSSLIKLYDKKIKSGKITDTQARDAVDQILSNITYTTEIGEHIANCDLVIEAIVEDMGVKAKLYRKLDNVTKPSCILASNTSSLSIQDMAEATNRPERVVGIHFFNPVQLMKLVEVVEITDQTDPEVYQSCWSFVESLGKTPVKCGDTPGFIVNRLLVPALAQAMAMVDRRDASIEDIDLSMKLGAGHPMGPLTLADYVGLDTCLSILEGWVKNYPDEPAFFVPQSLKTKVERGLLGRKTGAGFWRWDGDKRTDIVVGEDELK